MFPSMFRPSFERLDAEYFITTDDLTYTAYYSQYFGEPATLPSDDILIICLMNVTKAVIVLVAVEFQGSVQILRVGVLKHDTATLLYDEETPQVDLAIQVEVEEPGLYSCAVFFQPVGQYSVNIDVIYLS